ncbi:MAG: hypothetical protein QXI35_07900 [Candidatus Nezhaarchaeales archaeon]
MRSTINKLGVKGLFDAARVVLKWIYVRLRIRVKDLGGSLLRLMKGIEVDPYGEDELRRI